jgi:hypothetical protein
VCVCESLKGGRAFKSADVYRAIYVKCTFHFAGDLLENYCDDMNLARVLFCVSILLTYPLECFVAREVIK